MQHGPTEWPPWSLVLLFLIINAHMILWTAAEGEYTAFLVGSMAASNPANHSYKTLHELLQPEVLSSYSTILLTEDYTIKPQLYNTQRPIRLAGNITISSANYATEGYKLLNTEFRESFVLIPGYVTVVFRDIALGRARKTSGQGIPFFVGEGEESVLVLDNVVRIRQACALEVRELISSLNAAAGVGDEVAAGVPGTNSSSSNGSTNGSSNGSTNGSSNGSTNGSSNNGGGRTTAAAAATLVNFTFRGQLYPDSLHAVSVSGVVTPGDVTDTNYYSGYKLHQINATRVCLEYVDPGCAAVKGADACIMAIINNLLAAEAAAAAAVRDPRMPVAAVAVPVAVGGFLLLSGLSVLAVIRRRRRRQLQQDDKERQHQQLLPPQSRGPSAQASSGRGYRPTEDAVLLVPAGAAGDQRGGPGCFADEEQLDGFGQGVLDAADAADAADDDAHDERHYGKERGGGPGNTVSGAAVSGAAGTIERLALGNRGAGWTLVACHTSPEFRDATPSDRIKLGVLLGAGSFGRVYRGTWKQMTVAVKVLQHDSTTAAAISNEVDLVMSFRHRNIVAAYHFVTWRQIPAKKGTLEQQQQQQQVPGQAHRATMSVTGMTTVSEGTFDTTLASSMFSSGGGASCNDKRFRPPPGIDFDKRTSSSNTAGVAAAGASSNGGGAGGAGGAGAAAGAQQRAEGGTPGTLGSGCSSSSNVSAVLDAGSRCPPGSLAGTDSSSTATARATTAAAAAATEAARAAAVMQPATPTDHVVIPVHADAPQQQQQRQQQQQSSKQLDTPAATSTAIISPFAAAAGLPPFIAGGSSATASSTRGLSAAAAAAAATAAPPHQRRSWPSSGASAASSGSISVTAVLQNFLGSKAALAAPAAPTAPTGNTTDLAHSQLQSPAQHAGGQPRPPAVSSGNITSNSSTGEKHHQHQQQQRQGPAAAAHDADSGSVMIQLIPFTPALLSEHRDRQAASNNTRSTSVSLSAPLPEHFEFEHDGSTAAAAAAAATTVCRTGGGAGGGAAAVGGSAGFSAVAGIGSNQEGSGRAPQGPGAGNSSAGSSGLAAHRHRLAHIRPRGQPDEAQTWLILEYCDGGTLLDLLLEGRLAARGVQMVAHMLTLLVDIAAGMAYLHARNVLHGDLKPGNVLIKHTKGAPYGRVAKVSDFGLSRALQVGQTHRSTRTMGTMNHTPPELLRLGRLSPAGDIYAFGILMWECYTGEVAFSGLHYGELFEQVALHQVRPPVPEEMPQEYSSLMEECWAADPFSRPSFSVVQARLQSMLDQLMQVHAAAAQQRFVSDL